MSTKSHYKRSEIGPGKPGFSKTRSIIEAPFYGNNVTKVTVEPTEPNDVLLPNFPTTAISDILNKTCNKFDSIKGMLKINIFLNNEPLIILTSFCFILPTPLKHYHNALAQS